MFLSRFKRFLQQSAVRQASSLLAVFAAIATLSWSVTYWLVKNEIERLVDERLQTQMQSVTKALETDSPFPSAGFGQSFVVIENGRPRFGLLPFDIDLDRSSDGFFEYDTGQEETHDYRYLVQTFGKNRVIVAENVERQDELFDVLLNGLQLALFGSLSAAILTSFLIARKNQVRLNAISQGLAKVAKGDLSARINLPDRGDDLSLMANWTDSTTARLQKSMEQIRVQSANIAHDLRTPLARLRASLETRHEALLANGEPVSPKALEDALEQVDRIVGTFDALLRIARVESGAKRTGSAHLKLESIVRSVEEIFEPVVSEAGQHLRVSISEPIEILGDEELLIQLIANLLQNALRYGSERQTITINVERNLLSIADEGPGIPAAERKRVFDPLYQLEAHRQNEGFGLGLSLVRAIAELHHAEISISEGKDAVGLAISLEFPTITDL